MQQAKCFTILDKLIEQNYFTDLQKELTGKHKEDHDKIKNDIFQEIKDDNFDKVS